MYTKYSKKLNVNFSDRLVTKLYSRYVVYLIHSENKQTSLFKYMDIYFGSYEQFC
jgi:hypothetical protein